MTEQLPNNTVTYEIADKADKSLDMATVAKVGSHEEALEQGFVLSSRGEINVDGPGSAVGCSRLQELQVRGNFASLAVLENDRNSAVDVYGMPKPVEIEEPRGVVKLLSGFMRRK